MDAQPPAGTLVLSGVSFDFPGVEPAVVDDFSMTVQAGELVALVGPSGCGKTTLLNLVAGFLSPTAGEIQIDGQTVTGPGADRGVVFQSHMLFPWLTVYRNVVYGPRQRGLSPSAYDPRAHAVLERMGLAGYASLYPYQLSGGMAQRVAVARVLINDPAILLLDEPFGALDAQTRIHMQEWLLDVIQQYRRTTVLVTHDVDEAILLASRILVLSQRPARIVRTFEVPFGYPRSHRLATSPEYVETKARILDLLLPSMAGAR